MRIRTAFPLLSCFLSLIFLFPTEKLRSQKPTCDFHQRSTIQLWPDAAPGSELIHMDEKIVERSNDTNFHNRAITQITHPSIEVFIPEFQNGMSLLICPGGAYNHLTYDVEGVDVAKWLNSIGITAFILKYRLPGEGHTNAKDIPLQDAQRAMRLIRYNADDWNLNKNSIGVIGFSAGGHLASSLGTSFDRITYAPVDVLDSAAARPDFMVLLYPVISMKDETTHLFSRKKLIGQSPSDSLIANYSTNNLVSGQTPPTFIVLASDDRAVVPENSLLMYQRLLDAKVPTELHIFESGGHGFGIRKAIGPISEWPDLCERWLVKMN